MTTTENEADYSGKQLHILEAAERLFASHGFTGSSVRDIAQEAGVNVAMIGYYFGSKEKLLFAVFKHRVDASRMMLEHLLADKNMEPLEKIDALVESIVERMLKHRDFHRVLLNAQLTTGNEELSRIIADIKLKNLELFRQIITQGQRKKAFAKDVDTTMLVLTLTGTIYQVATGSAYLHGAFPQKDLSEQAYDDLVKKKLKKHLKRTLKAALIYEGH